MRMSDLLINRLQTGRKWTHSLISDIDEARWFEMPNGVTGHVAWQLGHIAASQVVLLHNRCFGKAFTDVLPDAMRLTFARGSTPVADSSKYPSIVEIRSMFERVHNDAIERVRTLGEADFDAPAGDEPHPLFRNKGEAILMAAMHETFHAGQIAMIRREFGMPALR